MVFRVDYLIYFYILLCICILCFNLLYMGKNRWHRMRNPKQTALWEKVVLSDTETMTGKRKHKAVFKKLSKAEQFVTFHETVQELLTEDGKAEAVKKWFSDNISLFVELGGVYMKKSQMEKSFYAFIIGTYFCCGEKKEELLANYMLLLVLEPSIYCRENALSALYKSGKKELVVRAFILMNRHQIAHSKKLIMDGLLTFRGDKEDLAEELWKNWEAFNSSYQIAFVDFIRMVSCRFGRRFFPLLSSQAEREVKLALLRYYRRYRYEDAEKILRNYVNNWCIDDWEFAALSASALENYPGKRTVRALIRGMKSNNWYVRNNSADSLLKITGEEQQQKILSEVDDSFERDMLNYKIESLKKAEEITKERGVGGDKQ